MKITGKKVLYTMLLATCFATTAQASPDNPAAVDELKSQLSLAGKGDIDAQYRVGEMYEKGLGTAQDQSLAIIWYTKASLQGEKRATDRLDALDHGKAADVRKNEQLRVDSVMKALRQQEAGEAARIRTIREKAAADKAAAEARARQQTQDTTTARAREKAAAEAAAAKTRSEQAKPVPVQSVPTTKPAEIPKKDIVDSERAEFGSNPCKGPQAKFLSTCK